MLVLWLPMRAGAINAGRRLRPPTQALVETWLAQHAAGRTVLLEDHWLDLRGTTVKVNRVADLPTAIAGGLYALGANDYIVIPEIHFGAPPLRRLQFVQRIAADQRSWTGNLGYDFEIYATPTVPALDRDDVRLGAAAAAPYFGAEWGPSDDATAGVVVPAPGAALYLPPLTHPNVRLVLWFASDGTDSTPPSLTVAGQPVALTPLPASGDERPFAATLTLTDPTHPTELRLTPAPNTATRIVRLQFD